VTRADESTPPPVPAIEISRSGEAELAKRRCGKRGGVALVADDYHLTMSVRLLDSIRARRIETPLEHVAFEHDCTGQHTIGSPVPVGANVDDERSSSQFGIEIFWPDTLEADPGPGKHGVNGAQVSLLCMVSRFSNK
jgi:hypothetical protein